MTAIEIKYQHGFYERNRDTAAALYDRAFGLKFSAAIPSQKRRLKYMARTFRPAYCIAAYHGDVLVGMAGYHDANGSLMGGITYGSLLWYLGPIRGNWAAFIFSFYEHTPASDLLIMDGIAVAENARGKGDRHLRE